MTVILNECSLVKQNKFLLFYWWKICLSVFQCFAGGYIKILNSNISENYTLEFWITTETKMWTILKNLHHVGENILNMIFF